MGGKENRKIIDEAHYTTQSHAWQHLARSSDFQHKNVRQAADPWMGGVTQRQDLKYDGGCRGDLLWSRLPRRVPESWWFFPLILACPHQLQEVLTLQHWQWEKEGGKKLADESKQGPTKQHVQFSFQF